MNVYDFDNTIYKGESALDFFWFCVKKKPRLIAVIPRILYDLVLYKTLKINQDDFLKKGRFYTESFFNLFQDIDAEIKEFWDKHEHKIKPFYAKMQKKDDVIVTANVDILVKEAFSRMGVTEYIATTFDMEKGRLGTVCFGKAKAELFKQKYGDAIDNFYTDSFNDLPLMKMSKKVYMVKGNKIKTVRI